MTAKEVIMCSVGLIFAFHCQKHANNRVDIHNFLIKEIHAYDNLIAMLGKCNLTLDNENLKP
jgi:hypothetical protein